MSKLQELIKELCPERGEFRKLGEVCEITIGEFVHKNKQIEDGKYPVYNGGRENTGFYESYNNIGNKVIISARGANAGYVNKVLTNYWAGNSCYSLFPLDVQYLNWFFLYYVLKSKEKELMGNQQTGSIPALSKKQIEQIEIPLPPLEVQNEIVRILDTFTSHAAELQAELQARKEQYEYYRNKLLTFDKDTKWERLGELVSFMNGKGHEKYIEDNGKYIVVNSKFISTNGEVKKYSDLQISPLFKDMILMVMSDLPNGKALAKCFIVDEDNKYTLNQRIGAFTIKNTNIITTYFLFYILNRNKQLLTYDNGVDQTNLRKDNILNISIPIPSLSEQQRIVSILDKFESLVNDLSEGLPAEIAAVQEQYEYYRNKLLTFKRKS